MNGAAFLLQEILDKLKVFETLTSSIIVVPRERAQEFSDICVKIREIRY